MSAELLALAERVEAAAGPDRELDRFIAREIGEERTDTVSVVAHGWLPEHYTASLDAAMTLVPEGWGWLVSQPNAKAIASGLLKLDTPVMGEVQNGCDSRFTVAAATPALALCDAALRARAAIGDPS